MPDYGRPVQFGVSVVPEAETADAAIATVLAADEAGLDVVGIQDHPYQRRFLDTWTLLAFLAGQTERIRLVPDVANLPLRQPAQVFAKAAATLDRLSGGRVELGLGAGAFWDRVEEMGGRALTPGESVTALEDAIDVIRAMWHGDSRVAGPPPAHDVGIWLGAYQPRMLRLTGRKADGWLPSLGRQTPEDLGRLAAIVDDAARAAGRDPAAIVRALNVSDEALGSTEPDEQARVLATLATDLGFDTFIYWPAEPDPDLVRAFAAGVVPKVLDVVATFRNP